MLLILKLMQSLTIRTALWAHTDNESEALARLAVCIPDRYQPLYTQDH